MMLLLGVVFLAPLVAAKLVPCSNGVDGVSKCFCVSQYATKCDAASAIQFMSSVENFGTHFQPAGFPFGPSGPVTVFTATSATAGTVTHASLPNYDEGGQIDLGCGAVGPYYAVREDIGPTKRQPPSYKLDYSQNIVKGVEGSATFDYSEVAFSFNFACAPKEGAFVSAWTVQGIYGTEGYSESFDGLCCIPDDDDVDDDGSSDGGDNSAVSDDSEIGDTGAPGPEGPPGKQGFTGAVGYTGAPGAAGPAGVLDVCSVALTSGNTAVITINPDGSCTVTPSKKRDVASDSPGVQARIGVSLVYKRTGGHSHRHHESSDSSSSSSSSSSDIDEQRCGPQVSLLINGQRVYKNSAVLFDDVGVVTGFVTLLLGTGSYSFELDVSARHCGDRRLVIENELIELTVVETGIGGVVSGSVQVPTLLQK